MVQLLVMFLMTLCRISILPHLMPFSGENPHSIVVLDNAAIHHIDGIKRKIKEVGALVMHQQCLLFKYNMFIFVDEAGADRRDTLKKYAYSWRGKPANSCKLLVQGKHVTAMALMSTSGIYT